MGVNFNIVENEPLVTNIEDFKKDYLSNNYTLIDLGQKYSISYGSVRKIVKELNLPVRPRGKFKRGVLYE